jgi:P4 family phage/plasmid primase-like protien
VTVAPTTLAVTTVQCARVPVMDYARANCFPERANGVQVRLMTIAEAINTVFSKDAHMQCFETTIPRRLGNKAIGAVPITVRHVMVDLDDPVVHAENASRKRKNKLLAIEGKPLLDTLQARPEWRAEQQPKLRALGGRHPGVVIYATSGGYRLLFALVAPFSIETKADATRWREAAYRSLVRYLRAEFDLLVDPSCADFCHLFRLPHVVREAVVGGEVVKQKQKPRVHGDPAHLAELDLERIMAQHAPKIDPRIAGELRAAEREVRKAASGTRHAVLVRKAYALGGYVPAYLDRETAFETLHKAIVRNGGDAEGDARKINEQLDAGMAAPRVPEASPARACRKTATTPPSEGQSGGSTPATYEFERGDHTELGQVMLAQLQGTGPKLVHDDNELHRFTPDRGVWCAVDAAEQSRIVQSFAGVPLGKKVVLVQASDVAGARKLAADQVQCTGFFASGPSGIAFSNGFTIVSAQGIDLRPLTPEMRARHAYEFAFIPKARPARMLKFLEDIWRDDPDKTQKIALIQEFAGLALIGRAPAFEKCIVALGKNTPRPGQENGSNGKSTLGKILMSIFRPEWVTNIPPHLFSDQYRRAQLAGKRLNVVGELPEADIMESEAFKAIVTGDRINARPIYAAPFDLTPQAGHFFSCNTLPGSNDLTFAFFRRFILLTFNRTFRPGDGTHVPDIDKLIVDAEAAEIVSWLLDGAVRALAQGRYTIPASHDEELAEWRRTANQVVLFIEENCLPSKTPRPGAPGHDWTGARFLYRTYTNWCGETGHKPMAENKFGSRMKQAGYPPHKNKLGRFYAVALRSALSRPQLAAREAEIEMARRADRGARAPVVTVTD